MTHQDKVIKLLDEMGVKYTAEGNTIFVENFYCDGAEEFGISFWDGEDYPKGEFHEFWVVPEEKRSKWEETHIVSCGKILRMQQDIVEHKCKACGRWSIQWCGTITDHYCSYCGAKINGE